MDELTERERLARLAKTCAGINLRRAARAITNHYRRLDHRHDDRLERRFVGHPVAHTGAPLRNKLALSGVL